MAIYDEADSPFIGSYIFAGGSITMSGIVVDTYGAQIGRGFSGVIPATGATVASLLGYPLPANAAGIIVNVSGDVYYSTAAMDSNLVAHFLANYASMYPRQIGPAYNIAFGKVR